MTPTPRQIAEEYIERSRTILDPLTLDAMEHQLDIIEDAVVYALDQIGEKELASELKRALNDSSGWQEAWLQRGERHRVIIEAKDKEIAELKQKIADVTSVTFYLTSK